VLLYGNCWVTVWTTDRPHWKWLGQPWEHRWRHPEEVETGCTSLRPHLRTDWYQERISGCRSPTCGVLPATLYLQRQARPFTFPVKYYSIRAGPFAVTFLYCPSTALIFPIVTVMKLQTQTNKFHLQPLWIECVQPLSIKEEMCTRWIWDLQIFVRSSEHCVSQRLQRKMLYMSRSLNLRDLGVPRDSDMRY